MFYDRANPVTRTEVVLRVLMLFALASQSVNVHAAPPGHRFEITNLPDTSSHESDTDLDPLIQQTSYQRDPNHRLINFYTGYDQGFFMSVEPDPTKAPFSLKFNSWLHLRHTYFDSDNVNPDQNTFSFERLRLSFDGHLMTNDLHYYLQMDGGSDRESDIIFIDYFVSFDLSREYLGASDKGLFGIKIGKWKMPFSRSRVESGRHLQFTDRAIANIFFDLNRSIGVGLFGRIEQFAVPIQYETAVFNGFRTGTVDTDRDGGLDRNFGWSARSYVDLISDFGPEGEADLIWHEVPTLRLGTALAYTRVDNEGATEFDRQRVVDSGAALSSLLPPGVHAYDVWLYTIDAHLKYQGFSILLDYYWRTVAKFSGGDVPGLFDHGFLLQAGYFIVPHKLELLCRWSRIVGDSGTLGESNESSAELGAGFAWYIAADRAKVIFDVTKVNGSPVNSSRLDLLPGDDGWLFRSQLQLAF